MSDREEMAMQARYDTFDERFRRPKDSNADAWAVFLEEHDGARSYIAVQIAEAIDEQVAHARQKAAEEMNEKCAELVHERGSYGDESLAVAIRDLLWI